MGEVVRSKQAEVTAVRNALELGYRLIDTAEMYGEGGAERIVGQALAESIQAGTVRRDDVFVVSKVYPHNASRTGIPTACDKSRARLGIETIDLYLLHWRGSHPLQETVDAFEALRASGRIGAWGVSNFDVDDMDELSRVERGDACATNQVYYSLTTRGPEFSLLPWQRERRMPLMAYSPIDQGALADDEALADMAAQRGITSAQVGLAWVLSRPDVIAIPKAVREQHLRENLSAADVELSKEELAELDARFRPPRRKAPLAMI